MIKNNLLIRALKKEKTERPPVWIMRQAGRYLPEFMRIKKKYDFFTRCQTPELATEITMLPINEIKPDAAIIFSDILVVLQAMGLNVEMSELIGPVIKNPLRNEKDINNLNVNNIDDRLNYVFRAIKLTKNELNNELPLIGFAGSPWTLLCYAIEGKGSKNFNYTKQFCMKNSNLAKEILNKITKATIKYLKTKIAYGVDVIKIFDSWGGILSNEDYKTYSLPYIDEIVKSLHSSIPVIVFAKGCWHSLSELSKIEVSALGIDWTCNPKFARKMTNNQLTLQGNFDPNKLFQPIHKIKTDVKKMISEFGKDNYIVNLGHGILPNTPVENVKEFINTVKDI